MKGLKLVHVFKRQFDPEIDIIPEVWSESLL